jgi:TonB family protein
MQVLTGALRRQLGDTIQAGTSTSPKQAATSARPGATRHEPADSSKLQDASSARIDPAAVQQVSRELALRIGPIAGVVVRRAASHCNSLEELYLKVSEEIDSRVEREKFLRGRAPIPTTPLVEAEKAATVATDPLGHAESPPPSEGPKGNDAQPKTERAATATPSSNQRKHLLLASVGGIFLVLLLVLVLWYAPWKGAGSSQPSQASDQETRVAESAPMKSGAPAPATGIVAKNDAKIPSTASSATGESEPDSDRRVRVPEPVSNRLLIKPISPVYPVLARQAHIQGKVVLDANISKDGRIETLKVISGDPLLIQAALSAAKELRYKPYLLNGQPVAVNTQIIVGFTLSGG